MYGKRKTLVKEYILPSLQIAATIIKIKAKTTTEIVTKTTKTLAEIKHTDNQILIVDLRDIAIFTRKRIVIYKDI